MGKIGKVVNQAKLAILSHLVEKLLIRQNWPFQVILNCFNRKRLEKLQIGQNWLFRVILSHFGGKRLEKL